MASPRGNPHNGSGFTLIDLLMVIAVLAIIAGIAAPILNNATERMRLSAAAREVERELQEARLRAVATNRPMRVRFDCPVAGQFRMVELIGTPSLPDAADSAGDRCDPTRYPYPAQDRNALTRPNHDGPLRRLPPGVAFSSSATIEFWPDGTAHQSTTGTNPWPVIATTGASVAVAKGGITKTITVNGLGKIQLR
jgi:prepilin-type N-terminal cleavage/methylation domain-containing protein